MIKKISHGDEAHLLDRNSLKVIHAVPAKMETQTCEPFVSEGQPQPIIFAKAFSFAFFPNHQKSTNNTDTTINTGDSGKGVVSH